MVGEYDNSLGLAIRVTVPVALVYSAYLVGFCPCETMLACEKHGVTFFALMLLSLLGVLVHMNSGAK
jgi:hypothetical protein